MNQQERKAYKIKTHQESVDYFQKELGKAVLDNHSTRITYLTAWVDEFKGRLQKANLEIVS